MDKTIYDFCVVGSSFASTGFLMSDKLKSKKVLCLDIGNKYINRKAELSQKQLFQTHSEKKRYMGQEDYIDDNEINNIEAVENFNIRNSYMHGGYSKIWGSVNKKNLATEQLKITGFNLQNYIDIINKKIPQMSLKNNDYQLASKKISFPDSTISVDESKCTNCGNCMYGCPHDAIFATDNLYSKVASNYKKMTNFFLDKIETKEKYSVLHLINIKTKKREIIKSKKVILGTGSINTSKILTRSFDVISKIIIKDSTSFFIPVLNLQKKVNITLPNKNIDLANAAFTFKNNKTVLFFQVYRFGYYLKNFIFSKIGFYIPFFNKFLDNFHLFIGFLPSNLSPKGEIKYIHKSKKYCFRIIENKKSKKNIIDTIKELKKIGTLNNLFFLNIFKQIGKPFSSYHFGAIELYNQNNRPIILKNSDGSIHNKHLRNIHLIDSSIFKEIPSGPLSLLIMANALRIADMICDE